MLDSVTGLLYEIDEARRRAGVVPAATALELLQGVYRNEAIPLLVRMRAAIEALPFETPKLSATAFVPLGEQFAKRLEKAVERSRMKVIEHSPSPAPTIDRRPAAPVADRGFRRA